MSSRYRRTNVLTWVCRRCRESNPFNYDLCRRCGHRKRDTGSDQNDLRTDGGTEVGVSKQFVVYICEDGRVEMHGGPYAPLKAREVRDAMRMHAENGRHREERIPEDVLSIEKVTPGRLRQLRTWNDCNDIRTDGGTEVSGGKQSTQETPRTDLCENCEREIVPGVVKVTGQHELIHQARDADEGFTPVTGGKVTISFSCRCSSVQIEYGPGSASAWDIPDAWMWESEFDE